MWDNLTCFRITGKELDHRRGVCVCVCVCDSTTVEIRNSWFLLLFLFRFFYLDRLIRQETHQIPTSKYHYHALVLEKELST
jgi:hypothetical protein